MTDQLLATFYVQSPESPYVDIAVTARVQYQSGANWYENTSQLRCVKSDAHYEDGTGTRRRYKIDVYRSEVQEYDSNTGQEVSYYPLCKAGTYKRRLQILFGGIVMLERMIYITIQPNLHVYCESMQESGERSQEDLVTTTETVTSQNPLQKQVTVNVLSTPGALAARNVILNQASRYKGKLFVKSNLSVDLVGNDLMVNSADGDYESWVRLQDKIIVTRKIKNNDYKWEN
jgi:hypothetical protein